MLTQCPACLTIFRVTGQILRMGHGQVRCGRCNTQFDALDRLLDDDEEVHQPEPQQPGHPARPGPLSDSPPGPPAGGSPASHSAYHQADAPHALGDAELDDLDDLAAAALVSTPGMPAEATAEIAADYFSDATPEPAVNTSPTVVDFSADLEEASRNLEAAQAAAQADAQVSARTGAPQSIIVDEPESLEEITMEGKRIEITGTYRSVGEDGTVSDEPAARTVTEEWAAFTEADEVEESEFATDDRLFDPAAQESRRPLPGDAAAAGDPFAAEAADAGVSKEDEFSWLDESDPGSDSDAELERPWAPIALDARSTPAPSPRPSGTRGAAELAAEPFPLEPFEDSIRAERGGLFAAHAEADRSMPTRAPLWAGLSVFAAIVLLAQIVHHYRHEWVRHPQLGPIVSLLYGFLGMPLAPDWNPAAYDVQQWGAAADPARPGTLRVRATITNRADFAQPYPLLRLVLEDRWGDQVGVRDFQPREYLQPGVAPDRLLAPAQKADAGIVIVDPGQDAVGFHLDICLLKSGVPVCTAESGR